MTRLARILLGSAGALALSTGIASAQIVLGTALQNEPNPPNAFTGSEYIQGTQQVGGLWYPSKFQLSSVGQFASSVVAAGAKCNDPGDGSGTDDTVAIRAAMDATPYGGMLSFPNFATKCLVSGTGAEIFLRTSPINVVGPGASGGGILVASAVPHTTDIFHIVPAPTGGAQDGWTFSGLHIRAVSGYPGNHIVHFDTTKVAAPTYMRQITLQQNDWYQPYGDDAFFDNGSLGCDLIHGGGCNTYGGMEEITVGPSNIFHAPVSFTQTGDTIRIKDDLLRPTNGPCIYLDQDTIAGAGHAVVTGVNCISVSGSGALEVHGSISPYIAFNEFEDQGPTNTELNHSLVSFYGPVFGATFTGNGLTADTISNNPNLLYISNTSFFNSNNNRFDTPTPDAPASFTGTLASGVLSVSGVTGTIQLGAVLNGSGVTSGTIITGGSGPYTTNGNQSLGPIAMTSTFVPIVLTDSTNNVSFQGGDTYNGAAGPVPVVDQSAGPTLYSVSTNIDRKLIMSSATTPTIGATITSSGLGYVAKLALAGPSASFAWFVTDVANEIDLYDYNASAYRIRVDSSGDVIIPELAGSGSRPVCAQTSGQLAPC